MFILDRGDYYEVRVFSFDLEEIGQSVEELIANLIEASGLIGKPLGEYKLKERSRGTYEIQIFKGDINYGKN